MVEITPQQHELMESQGFCVLENIFTMDDMEALAKRIEIFQRRHEEEIAKSGGTQGISRASEITFTCHLAQADPEIMAFCRRQEFIDITTQFLGNDVDLYWNQSVYKMPEGHKEFPWHQDDGYTPVSPTPYLTLWLAINDATPENGCISALPGSYKRGLLPHENTPIGLACHSSDELDQGVRVPVKAGSLAAFWSLTAHKSGPNVSNGIRKAYIIQYSKAGLINLNTGQPVEHLIPIAREGVGVA